VENRQGEFLSLKVLTSRNPSIRFFAMRSIEATIRLKISDIEKNIKTFNESRKNIIEDLMYLREHQNELRAVSGKTFSEFLESVVGFSKSYFYQLTNNYQFLEEHNRVDLFDKVDTKIIENIKRVSDQKQQIALLKKAEKLTRDDFPQVRVRPSDSDHKAPEPLQSREDIVELKLKPREKDALLKHLKLIFDNIKYDPRSHEYDLSQRDIERMYHSFAIWKDDYKLLRSVLEKLK
jgi:hypothetical protein